MQLCSIVSLSVNTVHSPLEFNASMAVTPQRLFCSTLLTALDTDRCSSLSINCFSTDAVVPLPSSALRSANSLRNVPLICAACPFNKFNSLYCPRNRSVASSPVVTGNSNDVFLKNFCKVRLLIGLLKINFRRQI